MTVIVVFVYVPVVHEYGPAGTSIVRAVYQLYHSYMYMNTYNKCIIHACITYDSLFLSYIYL